MSIEGNSATKLSGREIDSLRNRVFGFVFQQFFLNANDTVLNNIILPLKIAGLSPRERKKRGLAALEAVEMWNGVLEHPANSLAWSRFSLPHPLPGSWQRTIFGTHDGWVTEVSQVAYGHPARKRTWLYALGCELPALDWSEPPHTHVVGAGVHSGESTWAPRDESSMSTPPAFAEVMLDMARSAAPAFACVVDESAGVKEEA